MDRRIYGGFVGGGGAVVPGLHQEGKPGPDLGELLDDVVGGIHGSHGLIVYVGGEAGNGLVLLHEA